MNPLRLLLISVLLVQVASGQSIELAVQKGHSGDILLVTFSTTGQLIASAGSDHLIKLWHVPTGKEMASFESASPRPVTNMAFSPQDELLFVKYDDGRVHVWDIATSSLKSTSETSPVPFVRQDEYRSRDSSSLYYLEGYYLRKTDRRSGRRLYAKVPIDISQHFTSLAVNEEKNKLVAVCRDGKVYVFDATKGKSLATLEDHLAPVNSVCFSPDGRLFATASADRSIILWDTETLSVVRRLFSRAFRFESLAFDHTGLRLVAGDELGNERIIDLASSRINVVTYPIHNQKISSVKFSADDRRTFSAGFDNRLVTLDLAEARIVSRRTYRNFISMGDAFLKVLGAHTEPFAWVKAVEVSPTGQFVTAGGSWKEAEVRRQPQPLVILDQNAKEVRKLKAHQGGVSAIAFLSDYLMVTGHHENLYSWYYDAAARKYFYRENKLGTPAEIQAIAPLGMDTLAVNAGNRLAWFSLAAEKEFRCDSARDVITAVAANPRRHQVVYADGNDLVFIGQRMRRRVVQRAHTDKISAMALSPTRPVLATASWDATIKLWNADTGELLATLVAVGKEDHIVVTPDNFYFGTRNSLKGIGFKFGRQFISPEQFDLKFNRPDIVVDRLGYSDPHVLKSYRRAYQKRLQKMHFTEEMLSGELHLPELQVINPQVPLQTGQSSFTFQVHAGDTRYRINRINAMVNDVPVFGLAGIDVHGRQKQEVDESIDITLAPGKNKIQFSCLNDQGTESLYVTYEIECTMQPKKPDLYLAVVSVSDYQNKEKSLRYAVKDGRDLVNLYSRRADAFHEIHVDTLFDDQATRENILGLKEKLRRAAVEDEVVLYISGHGLLDDKLDFYFGTHDINFDDPAGRGMKYDDLENILDGIPARQKILLMDACHSGEVDKGQLRLSDNQSLTLDKGQKGTLKRYSYAAESTDESRQLGMTTSFELMQELFANLSKGSGSVVISAAAGNSYALESDEWRNGIFTYCILAGLKSGKADANSDGHVTVTELKNYVSREVERLTHGEQRPTSRRENLEFDFVVW